MSIRSRTAPMPFGRSELSGSTCRILLISQYRSLGWSRQRRNSPELCVCLGEKATVVVGCLRGLRWFHSLLRAIKCLDWSMSHFFRNIMPDTAEGDFFNGASPWMQRHLLQAQTLSRRTLNPAAIGPVTPLISDSVSQIRTELVAAAAQHSEFAGIQASLAAMPQNINRDQLSKWIGDAAQNGRPGIVSDF